MVIFWISLCVILSAPLAFIFISTLFPLLSSLIISLVALLIFPLTRKVFIKFFSKNYYKKKNNNEEKNFIDGEYKDIDDDK